MTENEALEYLKSSKRKSNMLGILPGSDIGNTIIKALEEVQQYRAIGTVEECREAIEKQKSKEPIKSKEQKIRYVNTYYCPTCNLGFTGFNIAKWCYHCGQKLDWSDVE